MKLIKRFDTVNCRFFRIRCLRTAQDAAFVGKCLNAEGRHDRWTSEQSLEALKGVYLNMLNAPGFYALIIEQQGGEPVLAADISYACQDSRLNIDEVGPGDWAVSLFIASTDCTVCLEEALGCLINMIFGYDQFRRLLFVSRHREPAYRFLLTSGGAELMAAAFSDAYSIFALQKETFYSLRQQRAGIYRFLP